ncbi:MAG: NAD(P)/FAD-dependent oxidoreductase [Candidatus Cloacimonetes bacterium]|nr:NAD(P)/FAD-dependent oxidoreductase [Candidatus Cloacimonadota bacterium]
MKLRPFYDIVVVGSGPAGSMTALFAAKNGASVLILERDREVGIPVRCAEGISGRGLEKFFAPDERWISQRINGAKLYAPNGRSCVMNTGAVGSGYILERRLFDAFICEQAVKNGADILTKADVHDLLFSGDKISGVQFTHLGEKKRVKAHIVVGADGPESRIGKLAGINTTLSLKDIESGVQYLLTDITIEQDLTHFYFGNDFAPGGYTWVFPKSRNMANVGIGIRADRTNGKNAKEYLDDFIVNNFPDSRPLAFTTGAVPTAQTLPEITKDNLMLVGDAARQVNPVTGGGLSNILTAGSIAGTVSADAVKAQDFSHRFLRKYHKLWMKEKGNHQKVHYKLKEVFFDFSDKELNEIVGLLHDIPQEKLTLFQLFKTAVRNKPSLVKELIKIYI